MKELAPLSTALESILLRLSTLESKVGVCSSDAVAGQGVSPAIVEDEKEDPPALTAYDEHLKKTVTPFVDACNGIPGLKDTGSNIHAVWMGLRTIVEIGTACKKPSDVQAALMPHLKPVQDAMAKIRQARLDRKYDWHIKAIMEMLVCASWVVMSAPPAPSTFIKDTIGSSDFWANKIRKEYKGKEDPEAKIQIAFCDTLKALILDLSAYVKQYHLSGLMWNPRGVAIEEYKPSDSTSDTKPKPPAAKPTASTTGAGGGVGDLMKELANKRTSDGSSAATGLKKVSRDQQTWRKEYKADKPLATPAPTAVKPSQIKASQKASFGKKKGDPVCKFQPVGSKWIVENQTKDSNPNGVCTIEIKNPKEQVYVYNSENATIQIKGKVKSVIFDTCVKSNLVFDTAISSCEVVNCKRVQIQSTGVCPSFSIDKTDGCLIYLSEEAVTISNFVTSKSSEMNVSWVDAKSGEQKEAPIPEQFVHKLKDGSITSDVSDLYH